MQGHTVLLICIFAPMLGAFVLLLLGKTNQFLRNIVSLLLVLVSFFTTTILLKDVITGNALAYELALGIGISIDLIADGLSVFMALIVSLLSAIILFYSFNYCEKLERQKEYYFFAVLFMSAALGVVFSSSLIILYIFWEIASICSWRLIGLRRNSENLFRADKAFLVQVGGSLLMLIGFLGIYIQYNTFELDLLQGKGIDNWLFIMILFGILSKAASLPLHTWLPDTCGASTPVVALTNAAITVNLGIYLYIRLFLVTFQPEQIWYQAMPIIAGISALIACGASLLETDLNRILSYVTIGQLGFVFVGASCGSRTGAAGAILFILMSALAMGGLFLCAGSIEQQTHTLNINEISGLGKRMPITTLAFALCMFSAIGFPPFGGFFAKYLIISGTAATNYLWMSWIFVAVAVVMLASLLRTFIQVFYGEVSHLDVRDSGWEIIISIILLALLSLLAGIFINAPSGLVSQVVESLGRW